MNYDKIQYELVGRVAVLRLADPDALNAMTVPMAEQLLDALHRGAREARAILLGSVGRAFCAGVNLAEGGLDMADPERDIGQRLDPLLNPIIYQMRASEIPVVTAVRGAAAGIGCGIALAADLIIAAEDAIFYQAFSKVGLAPDGGSSYLLARAVGRPRAMEMMLLGPKLTAATALSWGLINRVVAGEELDQASMAIAQQLSDGPKSIGIIKRVAWAGLDAAFETALSNERVGQREAGRTKDFEEGVAAFREKRPPSFKGR